MAFAHFVDGHGSVGFAGKQLVFLLTEVSDKQLEIIAAGVPETASQALNVVKLPQWAVLRLRNRIPAIIVQSLERADRAGMHGIAPSKGSAQTLGVEGKC
jgi:hypothetical protein